NVVAMLGDAMGEAYAQAGGAEPTTGVDGLREYLRAGVAGMWGLIETTPDIQLLTYEITTYALRRGAGEDAAAERRISAHSLAARQYAVTAAVAVEFLTAAAEATGVTWTESVEYVGRLCLTFIDGLVLRWLVDRDSDIAQRQLNDVVDMLVASARPAR